MRIEAIGRALREKRDELGLTQQQLVDRADGAGVTTRTIQRIERGDSSPSAVLLWSLCDSLGVSLHDLVRRAEELVRKAEETDGSGEPADPEESEEPGTNDEAEESDDAADPAT